MTTTAAADRLRQFLASVQRLEDVVTNHRRRQYALQLAFGGVVGAALAAVFTLWVTS